MGALESPRLPGACPVSPSVTGWLVHLRTEDSTPELYKCQLHRVVGNLIVSSSGRPVGLCVLEVLTFTTIDTFFFPLSGSWSII